MRKFILFLLFSGIILISCQCGVPILPPTGSYAYVGENQDSYIGSYAILDPSSSNIEEKIDMIYWSQNTNNPEQFQLIAYSDFLSKNIIFFTEEGEYEYYLDIYTTDGAVYSDTLCVKVSAHQNSVIEDLELEIIVRYCLGLQKGALNKWKLNNLDTLINNEIYLEDKITSLGGLQYCQNLTCLVIFGQSITDLSPISSLTKLKYIEFDENSSIEDISYLGNLVNLEYLSMRDNLISDISALGNLINLKELYLNWNPLTDISPFSNLTQIEVLHISNSCFEQKINSLSPISNLITLRHLYATFEELDDISDLSGLINLEMAYISFNKISDLSPLYNLNKLERIYAEGNLITSLDSIHILENLDFLNLDSNPITDISDLEFTQNLHLIGLSNSLVTNIKPIYDNSTIGANCVIGLINAPLDSISIYKYVPELRERGAIVYF